MNEEINEFFIKLNEILAIDPLDNLLYNIKFGFHVDNYIYIFNTDINSVANRLSTHLIDSSTTYESLQVNNVLVINGKLMNKFINGQISILNIILYNKVNILGNKYIFVSNNSLTKAIKTIISGNLRKNPPIDSNISDITITNAIISTINEVKYPKRYYTYTINITSSTMSYSMTKRFNDFYKLYRYIIDNQIDNHLNIPNIYATNDMLKTKQQLLINRKTKLQTFLNYLINNLLNHKVIQEFFEYPANTNTPQNSLENLSDDISSNKLSINHRITCLKNSFKSINPLVNEINQIKSKYNQILFQSNNLSIIVDTCKFLLLSYFTYKILTYTFDYLISHNPINHTFNYMSLISIIYTSLLFSVCKMLYNNRSNHLSIRVGIIIFMYYFIIANTTKLLDMSIYYTIVKLNLYVYLSMITFLSIIISDFLQNKLKIYNRLIYIYAISSVLIFTYLSIKLIIKNCKLSTDYQEFFYDTVDKVLAPFTIYHIKYLKSIYIKFAQYFSINKELLSSIWCDELSKLQDQCESSDISYVRSIILKELGDISNIFDDFDDIPIASASIGQIHYATLKSTNQQVVIKIQHKNIDSIMLSDIQTTINIVTFVSKYDDKWNVMFQMLNSWKISLLDELDFNKEALNLIEVSNGLEKGQINCFVPYPVPALCSQHVLVMTRLHGFKITDTVALTSCHVDREALLIRVAHCISYQLLVIGSYNADPHPGNLFVCPYHNPISEQDDSPAECLPGLLDFGMTIHLNESKRLLYCKLIINLYENNISNIISILNEMGYISSQSDRVPERDAEFFLYLFRDIKDIKKSKQENESFTNKRKEQKESDKQNGILEKKGRYMSKIPDDFMFLTRVIGLLRGLTHTLECECPILQILAIHAYHGINITNQS